MYESTSGVVLNVIKYNDRHNIAHIYTDRHGMMPYLVAQGNTAAARVRNSMFLPLSLLQFESRIVPGRELCTLHDVRRTCLLASIYADPVKNAVAMFMSELLSHAIPERERDEGLYRYIETAVRLLDSLDRGVANFHICFLFHLGAFLGIEPDVESYREGYWFDMAGGTFVPFPRMAGTCLKPDLARVIVLLSRMTFSNLHLFRFSREQRNAVLDAVIAYYRMHNSTVGTLKSPEILKQLFVSPGCALV